MQCLSLGNSRWDLWFAQLCGHYCKASPFPFLDLPPTAESARVARQGSDLMAVRLFRVRVHFLIRDKTYDQSKGMINENMNLFG